VSFGQSAPRAKPEAGAANRASIVSSPASRVVPAPVGRSCRAFYRVNVKKILRLTLRTICILGVALCTAFLVTQWVRQTTWYKERLYHLLVTGDKQQKLRAASVLAEVSAEDQLLRALKDENITTHEMARRAVEHVWFFAAGREAYDLMQAAYHTEERGDYKEAMQILDQLVAKYPHYAEAWNRRASVLWQMGDFKKSMTDCERALRLNPNHYGALQGKGVCLLKLGELPEACKALRAALKISPHDKMTHESLKKCEEMLRTYPPQDKSVNRTDLI
jgi:tetratricopeptide (TPR) repeat protein